MLTDSKVDQLAPAMAETQAAASSDRRRARRRSVFLRASIYPIDGFGDARIRDGSATGLMGETDLELVIGQTLHLTIDEQNYYAGKVRWILDRRFGVDVPQALAMFGQQTCHVDYGSDIAHLPRAPRVRLDQAARLLVGRPPRPAIVRNLSEYGMLLDTSPGLKPGQILVVRIGNAPLLYGRTQWSKDGRIGFRTQQPVPAPAAASAPN
ncbi:PilZ domain-containing protein [Novosphingobium sp.]|uniref:PilZ domain-containing protein n=1 Tax=Novosphingobium sp. TaxID=1874826 RepID=UPI0026395EBB|nr:PilZ domain-containing protein [Novosphingobium sp.]